MNDEIASVKEGVEKNFFRWQNLKAQVEELMAWRHPESFESRFYDLENRVADLIVELKQLAIHFNKLKDEKLVEIITDEETVAG